MNKTILKQLLATFVALLLCTTTFAQSVVTLTGQVVESGTNYPLPGVNVLVAGTTMGITTDIDGRFSISATEGQQIVVSYIGFADQTFDVTPHLDLSKITLGESTEKIDEIVVVGYGVQKKESSVGSIATTKGDDLLKVGSVNSVSEALQGQMPGVTAISTTSKPGEDTADIFIRGKATWQDASPLTLVDGVERDFNDVDVNEIESISVLKDASATAVYGVKGANGVILITTKRGQAGKAVVKFSANFGIKQPTTNYDYADYVTSMKLYNEAATNDGRWDLIIPETTIAAWENAYATGNYGAYNDYFPEVDWQDEVVKNVGYQQSYNINVSGGTKLMKYFASLGYLNDGDIYNTVKTDEYDGRFYYKRYNWRTNFDFNLTPTTELSVNIAGKMGYQNEPAFRINESGNSDSYLFGQFTSTATNSYPIQYSDGTWGADQTGAGNLVAELTQMGQRQYKSFQGFYDVIFKQKLDFITKGLSFKGSINYTTYSKKQFKIFVGSHYGAADSEAVKQAYVRTYKTYDYSNPIVAADGSISYPVTLSVTNPDEQTESDLPLGTTYDSFEDYTRELYYEMSLNYARSFGDHNVTALAVFNRRNTEEVNSGGSILLFPSYEEDWVGRVTYNYKEKYLAEINASYTGSEKFAPGLQYGFFPSFSVGWRITEEPFMKNLKDTWFNNLKLRYSWGQVGSDKGADRFNYIQLYSTGSSVNFGQMENVSYGPLYKEGSLAYPNATWETAIKQNFGLEMKFLKRLNVTMDLFNEHRTGILMEVTNVSPWIGTTLPSMNLGETKNHGMELELGWNDKIGKDFHYFAKFNFSTSESRIIYKGDADALPDYMKSEGKPIGYSSKYLLAGNLATIDDIFNITNTAISNTSQSSVDPGDFAYFDYNADGTLTSDDSVVVEELNYPTTTYSLSLGFNYKGLGVNAMFYATGEVYKADIANFLWDFPGSNIMAQPTGTERWTYEDIGSTDLSRPTLHITNAYNSLASTYSYTDHSYIRLKNLEVNYVLPSRWTDRLSISNCQVYVNGTNLFTISKCDDRRDPETGGTNSYPIVKRYNLGVRLTF